jgi:TonB family protein
MIRSCCLTMLVARRHLMPIAIVVLAAVAAVPAARAQDPPMDAAAAEIADAIAHAKQKSVIVLDFSGPDRKITPLGQKLADDFSAALAKSAAKIRVEDRSQIPGAIKANSYPLDFVNWGKLAHAFAQDIRVQAFVMGELSIGKDQLNVAISSYRADTGKNINSVHFMWPISDDDRKMSVQDLAKVVAPVDPDDVQDKYPNSGTHGYSFPTCLYCPRADYAPEAKRRRIVGTIELVAIAGEDGQLRDIRVLKPLPFGLTMAAIDAVAKWRLKPAIGPDGKPAAVRQIIEVTFQLY